MRLESGQVAVVTGGASGIGYAMAEAFGERGLSVVLADVEVDALDEATEHLAARGFGALGVPTDVSDALQVEMLSRRTIDRFGRVDVICNNAGVSLGTRIPMWEIQLQDWVWIMNVNLWGVINGILSFVPLLVERGQGHIVNTASLAGVATVPQIGPYTATKHAVVGLSESLATELAVTAPGVGVTVVCPAFVNTRLPESARNRPEVLARTRPAPPPNPTRPPGLEASYVAQEVVDAIEAKRLHIAPGPECRGLIQARVDRLVSDLAG